MAGHTLEVSHAVRSGGPAVTTRPWPKLDGLKSGRDITTGGKRAVLDGGFTRLYVQWDTADTARYVKNAAAWLVNDERFGEGLTLWR